MQEPSKVNSHREDLLYEFRGLPENKLEQDCWRVVWNQIDLDLYNQIKRGIGISMDRGKNINSYLDLIIPEVLRQTEIK